MMCSHQHTTIKCSSNVAQQHKVPAILFSGPVGKKKKKKKAKALLQRRGRFLSFCCCKNQWRISINIHSWQKMHNKEGIFSLAPLSAMNRSEPFRGQLYGYCCSRRTWIECSSAFLPGYWSSCQMLMSFGHYKPGADLNWWHKGERLHIPLPKPHIPLLISCAIWPTNNINFLTSAIIILHKNVKSVGMRRVSCYWLFSSLLI